jgi:hypothetical protein
VVEAVEIVAFHYDDIVQGVPVEFDGNVVGERDKEWLIERPWTPARPRIGQRAPALMPSQH